MGKSGLGLKSESNSSFKQVPGVEMGKCELGLKGDRITAL